jgi:hypothetical protein
LVFVAFFVGSAAQFVWRGLEEESCLFGIGTENSEFFVVIGRTSLKARNCRTAAS